ncbi:ubiquitin carboxyl-hydrolase [uncultured Streptococcus sp.]|uniref:ubiquitin carboxyl-hydrolase n=1 Tax=uncultured Streptococcus sp. TaxID=83427 RepID=UPI002621EA6B|nr:ubiquitin carboxyl-hydrolase [uncultured Streptococcus sp.]
MKISKLLLIVFIGFLWMGTLGACSQQKKTEQKEEVTLTAEEKKIIRKQEEALALFLVNNFEDIKKIEFISIVKGGFGTSDVAYMKINDKLLVDSSLQDTYDINHYSLGYHQSSKFLVRKEAPSSFSNIDELKERVIYYEGRK